MANSDPSVVEILGVLGFGISAFLAALRLFEFYDARVRLKPTTASGVGYYGDSQQEDERYELLLTNMGNRPTTITFVTVHPYKRRFPFGKDVGTGEMFLSDETGLGHITVKGGESTKFDFPHHMLNFNVSAAGEKKKADGQICRLIHTASPWTQEIALS